MNKLNVSVNPIQEPKAGFFAPANKNKCSMFKPFYDEDGYTTICKDCCNKTMRKILKQHGISKLRLKNQIDFQVLMEVAYDFIAYAENAEIQKEHEQED
jgi:hypothetical protein